MTERFISPWTGNWRDRLNAKLHDLGHSSLDEFFDANQGKSYLALAKQLGDANIAAMQLYGEQLRVAASNNQLRTAAKDHLVRAIVYHVKRGWKCGRHFLYRRASVYGDWSTSVAFHAKPHESASVKNALRAVFLALERLEPEKGWMPLTSNDPLIERAFSEGWPE